MAINDYFDGENNDDDNNDKWDRSIYLYFLVLLTTVK
jgi:hypothetical protein